MSKSPPSTKLTPSIEKTINFLFVEYGVLKDMYSESESAIQSLFNFYMTVLSAIIGAVILVFQVSKPLSLAFGVIGGLLIFAIIIGIFYQWGIVDKYAELIHYARSINEIKINIVKYLPEAASSLYEIPVLTSSPTASQSSVDRWEAKMWWLFPIDSHQLFIAFINSICLSGLIWIPLLYTQAIISNIWQGAIASFIVFWLSIIANDTYAKIKLRRELSKIRRKISAD
jgi:hypothetical protein